MPDETKTEVAEPQETKNPLKSKTIWGLIVIFLSLVGGEGAQQLLDQETIAMVTKFIEGAGALVGLGLALYGRIKAKAKLVFGG